MSSPYTLPVGPTRLAERITSMPPPEPRSRTTSPGCNLARAVGLPQPSDAATAFLGNAPFSASPYKSLVIGSQPLNSAPPPQQAVPPLAARFAASPYFCFTASRTSSLLWGSLINSSLYFEICTTDSAGPA